MIPRSPHGGALRVCSSDRLSPLQRLRLGLLPASLDPRPVELPVPRSSLSLCFPGPCVGPVTGPSSDFLPWKEHQE